MNNAVTFFRWPKHPDGHRWIKAVELDGGLGRFLTDSQPLGGGIFDPTFPDDHFPTLFRLFADIQPDDAGIVGFADKFGLLGVKRRLFQPPGQKAGPAFGETKQDWLDQLIPMRRATRIWDLAQAGDVDALAAIFEWNAEQNTVTAKLKDEFGTLVRTVVSGFGRAELLSRMTPGDLIAPARAFVVGIINEHLAGSISPRLLLNEHEQYVTYLVPDSLAALMWMQFCTAVDQRKSFRRCLTCSTWFEPTRSDKKYCSETCRAKFNAKKGGK